ncbi:lysis inhibition [Salmonella phage vB_SalD_ABTNLS3]|nr:lysis inhibition [Salmonella phage vB_SalD_ABTNLS3]
MDIFRTAACILMAGCLSPTVSLANNTNDKLMDAFASSAMPVYAQMSRPSVKASEDYWAYLNASWKNSSCQTVETCSIEGRAIGERYAKLMKVEDEVQ